MSPALSPRESEMLAHIRRLKREHGYMPTRQEIADAMGQSPGGNQRRILYGLVEKGRLSIEPRVVRGLVLRARVVG